MDSDAGRMEAEVSGEWVLICVGRRSRRAGGEVGGMDGGGQCSVLSDGLISRPLGSMGTHQDSNLAREALRAFPA